MNKHGVRLKGNITLFEEGRAWYLSTFNTCGSSRSSLLPNRALLKVLYVR